MKGVKILKKIKLIPLHKASPNPLNGGIGIIEHLQDMNVPWGSLNISHLLDIYYYGNHSGNKIISPLIENILGDNDTLTTEQMNTVANIIYSLFNKNWNRMWYVYSAEYDPAENYNMTENGLDESILQHGETITRTDNLTKNDNNTMTNDLSHTKTGTETETPQITETNTPNTTRTINNGIYGFNSNTSQPSDTGTETNTGTNTIERTGTDQKTYNLNDADTGTQTNFEVITETGTQTHAHSGNDKEERTHQLTRHGNIGVTTTQQMLQSEIDLWQWDFFNNVLFPNIDGVLTIQIY